MFLVCILAVRAETARRAPLGVAWDVRGAWHVGGETLQTGDAIVPGSLLQPDVTSSPHSITVLLPDGQRILYECFVAEDCARGFRIPPLYGKADEFSVDLLARVRAVLAKRKRDAEAGGESKSDAARDEAVAVLGEGNTIQVAGLVSALQNGTYTYDVHSLSGSGTRQTGLKLEKTSRAVTVAVPGEGLYELTIVDALNNPRIDLLAAAIKPSQTATVMKRFEEARARLKDWNEDNQGWPIHDVQRALLESLMLGIPPQMMRKVEPAAALRSGVTAEPQFSPTPDAFKGDGAVTLRCDTPGAVIHYTVDGSQPLLSSPVYKAPVLVQNVELMVRAFASAPGKKDSPVVTGIFRVEDQ